MLWFLASSVGSHVPALMSSKPAGFLPTGGALVNLLITTTLGGFAVAALNAFASRRKTKAEAEKTHAEGGGAVAAAAKVSTETAVALMGPMRDEMLRLAARVTQLEAANAELRADFQESEERGASAEVLLQAYATWTAVATAKLRAAGIEIDPPPQMARRRRPPRQRTGE